MHYCFFTSGSWEKNGALLRLRDLGSALIRRGIDVSYMLSDLPANADIDLHPAARRFYVPYDGKVSLREIKAMRRALLEARPDYVHTIAAPPKVFLTLAGTNLKLIADWGEWPARRPYPFLRKRAEIFLDNWHRRRAHRCVVASRYMQQQFKKEFGVDALYLPHAKHMPDYADGPSPFTEPTAVYMGNFFPAYDHDILFDAAMILRERGLTPRMELIADGPDLPRWREFVKEKKLENVTLTGYLDGDELWRHLRHAHVLLFPLRYSELNASRCPGKTFFYAQAARPVITTSVGEVPEVLKERGTYVQCTPEAFADAIAEAMRQPVLADVDYRLENWDMRAQTLLEALGETPAAASEAPHPPHASMSVAGEGKGVA